MLKVIINILTCLILFVHCDEFNLILLHNNDMHSRFEQTSINSAKCQENDADGNNCVGGFARTAHEIRRHRQFAQNGNTGWHVIYLNAGDTYIGTEWFSLFKWRICVDFIRILQPDAMSLGNHEFDNGVEGLIPFVNALNTTPILASNLDLTDVPDLNLIKKSVILEISNRKIGIIGHLTEETRIISQPGAVKFRNVIESVRNESERLVAEGINIIIALGHSGYNLDQQIAAEIEHVDVVVGGHTNTFLWNGQQPSLEHIEDPYPKVVVQKSGKRVPVVQAYAYTKYLGRLNLTFDENGDLTHFVGQPILLDSTIHQDEDVLALLDPYRPEMEALNSQIIGKTRVLLDGRASVCRFSECNFGNLIADAFVYYIASNFPGESWTNTPIGLVNGGGIRNSINPSNNISYGDILSVLPYDNSIITLSLTGEELIKTLEIGIRGNGETSNGEFLQVSGLRVLYDRSKPALSRVVSVKVRCGDCLVPKYEEIDLNANYTIVTIGFLVDGGDGHYILSDNGKNKVVQDLNDLSILKWYLETQSPVYPEIQGRIQFVKHSEDEKGRSVYVRSNIVTILTTIFLFTIVF